MYFICTVGNDIVFKEQNLKYHLIKPWSGKVYVQMPSA